jgi:hypothetical protein
VVTSKISSDCATSDVPRTECSPVQDISAGYSGMLRRYIAVVEEGIVRIPPVPCTVQGICGSGVQHVERAGDRAVEAVRNLQSSFWTGHQSYRGSRKHTSLATCDVGEIQRGLKRYPRARTNAVRSDPCLVENNGPGRRHARKSNRLPRTLRKGPGLRPRLHC